MTSSPGAISQPGEVTACFLAGAHVVVEALADSRVAEAWDRPSVLEEQTVASLAGHLARGAVWLVGDYLHAEVPQRTPNVDSAGAYFARFAERAGADEQRAIRDRGAAVASVGWDGLVATARQRLDALAPELEALAPDHLVAVIGGTVMRLSDYLLTRIVEQALHVDDLARSVGGEPWAFPPDHLGLAVSVGVDIARRRHGTPAVLRAVFRRGFAEQVWPAL